jgi:hypothetical protein
MPARVPPDLSASRCKAELPGWTVVYYDESAAQRAGWDAPRWAFEYAV